MDSSKISVRYAKAAYEFAKEKGEETSLYEEMKVLERHLKSFKSMIRILDDPTISTDDKEKILTTAAGEKSVSDSYRKLLELILKNKREGYILSIALMYQTYYRKQKDIIITKLITTEAATDDVKGKIIRLVAGETKEKVDLITKTDPSLIGGFILELEDQRLNASIKHQLNQLKQQLIK